LWFAVTDIGELKISLLVFEKRMNGARFGCTSIYMSWRLASIDVPLGRVLRFRGIARISSSSAGRLLSRHALQDDRI
jgi:hypothetical protein